MLTTLLEQFYIDDKHGDVLWMTGDDDHAIYLPISDDRWLCLEILNGNWPALTVAGPRTLDDVQLWGLHRAATFWNIRCCTFDPGVIPGIVGEHLDEFSMAAVPPEWRQRLRDEFGDECDELEVELSDDESQEVGKG